MFTRVGSAMSILDAHRRQLRGNPSPPLERLRAGTEAAAVVLGTLAATEAIADEVALPAIPGHSGDDPATRHALSASRRSRHRTDAIITESVALEKREVILNPHHRAGVARKRHDGKRTKDRVDGAAFEPEVAQVSACEQRVPHREQFGSHGMMLNCVIDRCALPGLRCCMTFLRRVWRTGSALLPWRADDGRRLRSTADDAAACVAACCDRER